MCLCYLNLLNCSLAFRIPKIAHRQVFVFGYIKRKETTLLQNGFFSMSFYSLVGVAIDGLDLALVSHYILLELFKIW